MQGSEVFVADDDDFAATTIAMMIQNLKGQAKVFTDGISLVNEYKKRNGSGVAFILMDITMPVMNGFAATQEIRTFEKSKGIAAVRVYGLSGDTDKKTLDACKAAGMNDLLGKPLKKDKLQALFQ